MRGQVFDIQHFALHDGPGIRTTVFLKGCSLRCAWCCNPESQLEKPQLSFRAGKCTNCLHCVGFCKDGALINRNGKLEVNYNKCTTCGLCIDECPEDALRIIGWEASAEDVIAEVVKDMSYYQNSGGGLTVSGGEPLGQAEFLVAILRLAKGRGIHTCIETSGLASLHKLKLVIPHVDLFLFDYKITDAADFKTYVKANQNTILKNLDFLSRNHSDIILRCPLIPGINDNDVHFQAIADLSNRYRSIQKVEIMAYHNWGSHKYSETGMKMYPVESLSVNDDTVQVWISRLLELGCKNVAKG